jgi:hypothetical protein
MKPQSVAVFLGSDLSSHLIANRLIRVLTAGGHSVSVHYTYASANPRAAMPLRELFFVERRLLTEYAYPYLDKHGEPCPGRANSPQGWRALSLPLVHVEETENVNDATFIGMVAKRGYDVSVSIRCYQKFRRSLICTLTADGAVFANLHPGILPAYRGVLTFSRALFHGDATAGYTLHHVNERWDAGSIIAKRSQQLDPSASVLENMCRQGGLAAQLVVDLDDSALFSASKTPTAAPIEAMVVELSRSAEREYSRDDRVQRGGRARWGEMLYRPCFTVIYFFIFFIFLPTLNVILQL